MVLKERERLAREYYEWLENRKDLGIKDNAYNVMIFLEHKGYLSEKEDFIKYGIVVDNITAEYIKEIEKHNEELIAENKRITEDFHDMEKQLINMDAVINQNIKNENEVLKKQNEELIKVLIVTYKDMCESCHIVKTCPFYCHEKVSIKKLLEKHLQKPIDEIINETKI